ncbi:hypothetical protein [Pseudomonas kulmbachensis]|uniref:hypothetical protein n=1 Tax=Pseudomonas kulmbachensis TaxID=3043408 RepID=UPI002AAF80BD|nr:hypothetical protein [Pseudomonas sp. V3/3/4/13]
MAGKTEIIIGVINDGATVGSGATAIADQFVVNKQGMELVSQTAQAGAVIASITSVTKLAGPYVPIISMPGNTIAGTITFLKVGVDIREGRKISPGDVLSLVGNVAGIIGTFAILVGAGSTIIVGAAVVSAGASLLSIIGSETLDRLMNSAGEFFNNNPSDNYLDYICAPDMRIVDRNTIRMAYANMMLSCNWMSDAGELLPSSVVVPNDAINSGAGGRGPVFGGTYSPSGPVIPSAPPPPHNVGNVGISIIVSGNTYDAGDQYGCCTGASDGYM